ncbi:hypothetical protein MmTuc01_1441 [Methanosarcina mazei Tuc01]|uniref:Uncharacterized protein n=1 Tax=Methanosarcina mazei Tuc01 TaxID=1236903 RepID=M1Q9D8_METMZ|nr:hypothetical protein MmTuc01_1441 [Methanosarcina mazei Tuc01]
MKAHIKDKLQVSFLFSSSILFSVTGLLRPSLYRHLTGLYTGLSTGI